MEQYSNFISQLNKSKRFIIASHYNPDGDAIGSMLAMRLFLERMGKNVTLYNRDLFPSNLSFLSGVEKITNKLNQKDSFDMAIIVDCAQKKRVSDDFAAFKNLGVVVCIDHHLLEDSDAAIKFVDSEAASTGEVVLRIMKHAKAKIDEPVAQCIYTTLVVDTGFFKYSNTNANIFLLAHELVLAGANPWVVAKNIEESYPASRFKLLGASLSTIDLRLNGKYATMDVTQKMLKDSGAEMDMSDEFATFPRAIDGVEVAALFRELEDGRVKISMRSKDVVDVAAVARSFGGGGHARAAGFRMKSTLQEAKEKVYETVEKLLF